MRRILFSALMATVLVLAADQQASAWVNFKFGVGANIDWQSGGNNLLWGAARGSQPPGPEAYGHGGFGHPGGVYGPQFSPSYPMPAAPAGTESKSTTAQPTSWYGSNPYQAVGYSPYYNPYYTTPYHNSTYYIPTYYGR